MKTILKNAGLPSIRFHDLRHTLATHVTGDMQKRAAEVVGDFITDIFGEELKPWQENEKLEKEASI